MMAPKEICGSMSKILPRFPQWILPRISLPAANIGKIPSKIAARFWLLGICFSAKILSRFTLGSRRDFGCREIASLQESWRDSQQDPGKILAVGTFASQQESQQDLWQDPSEILAAGNFDPAGIPAGNKNSSSQNLARIPAGFLPRFRSLFYKG